MKPLTTSARALIALICLSAFVLPHSLHGQTLSAQSLGNIDTGSQIDAPGGVKGKPKPTPSPTPDGESDWKNTGGTDWNTGANWTAVSGSAPPVAGDVAWFKTAFSSGQPNLSASTSIAGFYFNGTGTSGYDITSSTTAIKFTLTGTSLLTTALTEISDATANAIRAENTSGTNTIDAPIILGGAAATSQAFVQARGGTLAINGVISSTNAITGLQLLANGAAGVATFTLAGANTYSGSTTITTNDVLNINNATAISSGALILGGNATIDNTSGSAITLANNNALNITNGSLTFTGANSLSFGTGAVTIGATNRTITVNGSTLTLNGVISSGGGTLTKAGVGTLTLGGANGGFAAGVVLSAGTLNINNASALGTGTFNISAGPPTIDNTSGAAITLSTNNAITFGSNLTFTGTNDLNLGTGAMTLSGANRTLTVNGGTLTIGGVIGQDVAGRALTKLGAGTLILANTNTYTGNTSVSAGTLSLQAASAVNTGYLSVTGTGTLNETVANAIGGTALLTLNGASAIANLSQANSYSGATTLSAGTLSLGNKGAFGSSTVAWNGVTTSATADLSGANAITNSGTLGQSGNIFNGSNNLELSGTLTNTNGVGGSTNTITSSITGGNTLTLSGTLNLSNSTLSRTVNFNGTGNTIISGVVANGGTVASNLSYSGSGTLTLTNTNTYTGTTTVSGGTLYVNGSGSLAAGSAVTVSNAGTILGGAGGTINGTVSVGSGAILQGGTGATGQTLNLAGAVTMNTGSILSLALGAPGAHSTIAMTGGAVLTFATNQDFKFIDVGAAPGTYNGLITGVADPTPAVLSTWIIDNGYAGSFSWDAANGGEIDLTLTAIPEPGTWFAASLALGGLLITQRKRFKALRSRA